MFPGNNLFPDNAEKPGPFFFTQKASANNQRINTENIASNPPVQMIYSVSHLFFYEDHASFGSTANPVSIQIDEISTTFVRGTFKGVVKYTNQSSDNTIRNNLENSIFNVSF